MSQVRMCYELSMFMKEHYDKVAIIHLEDSDYVASVYPGDHCNPEHPDYDLLKSMIVLEVNDVNVLLNREIMAHELTHIKQIMRGDLKACDEFAYWRGRRYPHLDPDNYLSKLRYHFLPWEIEAYREQHRVTDTLLPFWPWYLIYSLSPL